MNKRKILSVEDTQHILQKLKSKVTINALRNETGLGVNILKRILKENNIPYISNQNHKGRVAVSFADTFTTNSKSSNSKIVNCIKQHNLIPYDKCYKCGLDSWIDGKLVLELDHINGNNTDNQLENLQFLCPNCHSQTPTYKGRNISNGLKKVSDQELLNALKQEKNIRKALMRVGLTPKGANYDRAYNLLNRN